MILEPRGAEPELTHRSSVSLIVKPFGGSKRENRIWPNSTSFTNICGKDFNVKTSSTGRSPNKKEKAKTRPQINK
jgi:hypothetical protein